MIRRFALLLLAMVMTDAGCKSPSKLPPLNPVKGRIVNGGAPVAGATVVLAPVEPNQHFTVSGITDEQGNFELHTIEGRTNTKRPGAPEGAFILKVIFPPAEKRPLGWTTSEKVVVQKGDNNLPAFDVAPPKK